MVNKGDICTHTHTHTEWKNSILLYQHTVPTRPLLLPADNDISVRANEMGQFSTSL